MVYPKEIAHGIMFHHFHDETHPQGQGSISQKDFERILNHIGRERILSPQEWLEKVRQNKLSSEDLCLTFDDGLRCQVDVALPLLEHCNLKAFWFVYSNVFEGVTNNLEVYRFFRTKCFKNTNDFYAVFFSRIDDSKIKNDEVEKYQKKFPFYSVNDIKFRIIRDQILGKKNYEQIMDDILLEYGFHKSEVSSALWMSNDNLKDLVGHGHQVGLHTYAHPTRVEDLSLQEQFEEYEKNYLHLKNVCGQKPLTMSHPCNSYNDDTLRILKDLGLICGFRSNLSSKCEGKSLNASPFEIAREDHANIMVHLKKL